MSRQYERNKTVNQNEYTIRFPTRKYENYEQETAE